MNCFNPELYRDGAQLETTVRWTASGEQQRVLEYDTIVRDIEQAYDEGPTTESATELRMYPSAQPSQIQHQAFDTYTRQTNTGRVFYVRGYYDSQPLADPPPGTGPEWNHYESYFFYENDPPREFRYDLVVGDNYRQQYQTSTSELNPFFYLTAIQLSTTYLGREVTAVPAGRFNTCKFTESILEESTETQTTTWIAVGTGITVRRERKREDTEELFELVSAAVNGKPLQSQ